jgi:hypothetical protein
MVDRYVILSYTAEPVQSSDVILNGGEAGVRDRTYA